MSGRIPDAGARRGSRLVQEVLDRDVERVEAHRRVRAEDGGKARRELRASGVERRGHSHQRVDRFPAGAETAVHDAATRLGTGDESHVLGFGTPLPAASAALASGMHGLDFVDTHVGAIYHATSPALAAPDPSQPGHPGVAAELRRGGREVPGHRGPGRSHRARPANRRGRGPPRGSAGRRTTHTVSDHEYQWKESHVMTNTIDVDAALKLANYKGDDVVKTANYATDFPSVKDRVNPEEWQARVDLAACYRLVDIYGMSDLTYNHITVRVPGTDTFLINLYGLLYKEVTASSLAKVDLDGNVVWKPEGTDYGVNAAGYVIHSAVHAARDDIDAVIHTHSVAGMAVASMKSRLLPLSQHAMRFTGHLAYHDYEGPALSEKEKKTLVADLGEHRAMILRNHGLLAGGRRSPRHSTCSTSWRSPAGRRSPPWPPGTTRCRPRRRRSSTSPRTSSRPARSACWNGRRCCGGSKRRASTAPTPTTRADHHAD
jgi:ribulose-5-phosphate 4-epimerase/fuculose-1-phosphate aldolase